jgi:hypothetical protein
MKKCRILAFLVVAAIFPQLARPQTTGTSLILSARWDDGTRIIGTVTLLQQTAVGTTTVIATEPLIRGRADVSEILEANALYYVTLVSSTGTQLVKFPVATAMINPSNLQRAEIDLVCRKADSSVKSAQISVSMGF